MTYYFSHQRKLAEFFIATINNKIHYCGSSNIKLITVSKIFNVFLQICTTDKKAKLYMTPLIPKIDISACAIEVLDPLCKEILHEAFNHSNILSSFDFFINICCIIYLPTIY